jgi:DNA polymerase-4
VRDILLVDMNAFFIMCESRRDTSLLDIPAAVAGDPKYRSGIVFAANYKARSYGVRVTMTLNEALKLCPQLKLIPPDHAYYEKCSDEVFHLLSDYTPVMQINSIDEAWLDVTDSRNLFGSPYDIAVNIQDRVKNELGLWCSIGISENKFLAKMASEMKKPLGITTMYIKDVERMLWHLPVGTLYGVGKAGSERLNKDGIITIGDLAKADLVWLLKKYGRNGLSLYEHSRGIDNEIVESAEAKNVSSGRSTTLASDITDLKAAKAIIADLSESICRSCRKQGLKGSVVQIQLKYNTFETINRQMSVDPTNLTKDVYEAGKTLLEMNWDESKPVRLLGITLNKLESDDMQLKIQDDRSEREEKLEKTIDGLKDRFGKDLIKRGDLF